MTKRIADVLTIESLVQSLLERTYEFFVFTPQLVFSLFGFLTLLLKLLRQYRFVSRADIRQVSHLCNEGIELRVHLLDPPIIFLLLTLELLLRFPLLDFELLL